MSIWPFHRLRRIFQKDRLGSILNVAGLSIGMAAAVLIFLWVNNEESFDKYHKDSDRIYRLKSYIPITKEQTWIWESSPFLLGSEISGKVTGLELVTRLNPVYAAAPLTLALNHRLFQEKKAAYVDSNWFNMFRYHFREGSPQNFYSRPYSLILTRKAANRYFGNASPTGRVVVIDSINYVVAGVVDDYPVNSSFEFDVLIPAASQMQTEQGKKNAYSWGNFNYQTFVKLRPDANQERVVASMQEIFNKARNREDQKLGLISLADMHFESDLQSSSLRKGDSKMVRIFSILGMLLLLVACINYVNLTTARASRRAKEVSVRKIVGAAAWRLFLHFMLESVILSSLSLAISFILIQAGLPFLNRLTGQNFNSLVFSWPILKTLLGTWLVSIVLTGIYPALLLIKFKPVDIFRGKQTLKLRDAGFRRVLVILQFSFSIVLIVGVLVVYNQLRFIRQQHKGYDLSQVLSISTNFRDYVKWPRDERISRIAAIKTALLSQAGVQEVCRMNGNSILNNKGFSSGGTDWIGRPKDFDPAITFFEVDEDFIKLRPMEFVEGGWFNEHPGENNVVLNQTAVRELGLKEPLVGQWFVARGDTGTIAGVVKDFHFTSLHQKITPLVIKNSNYYSSTFLVKLEGKHISGAMNGIRKVWKSFFPSSSINYQFMDEEFDALYKSDESASLLLSIFAFLAILISAMGLFGLAAFSAERRTKEIGIRKVLGADVSGIVGLLSREFIYLVVIALLMAAPVAWWAMDRWLEDFAYHIQIRWWYMAAAGLVALCIALLPVGFHAIRAALANPTRALRTE